MQVHSQTSFHDYFLANDSLDRGWLKNGLLAVQHTLQKPARRPAPAKKDEHSSVVEAASMDKAPFESMAMAAEQQLPPHRRRWQQRKAGEAVPEEQLPLDASSRLATTASALEAGSLKRTLATYLSLSKPRLSFLILLTTTSAYSLYPIPDIFSSTAHIADTNTTLSTTTLTLTFLTSGTFLSCASANAFNMLFEPEYDALMTRTRNRPLVRGLISKRGALLFAILTGVTGLVLLDFGTNPTVAALSGLNIFLYGFVYTPMKRLSWLNTWVGAIVGGIPPLMGWAAAAGETATTERHSWRDLLFSESSIGGWLLACLLFAWQFPHFNSLSHTIRDDYKNAGHKMLAWMHPARNARVALRYSVAMFPICFALYHYNVVNPAFLLISTGCNAWMLKEAVRFYKFQGAQGSARGLFWASVWQLPLVLVGALLCKTGIWDGFFGGGETFMDVPEEVNILGQEEDLGMESAMEKKHLGHDGQQLQHNLAMLGFKRPS